jgi:hypothetical protein
MTTAVSDIDSIVGNDLLPPAEGKDLPKWNAIDSDNRVKLFFLGNWPKAVENPDLHFLITPRGYEPGFTPGTHQMMYFSISPNYVYSFSSNDATIEPVQAHNGTYLIFHDSEYAKERARVVPFMFKTSPDYKLSPKSIEDTIRDIREEIWLHNLGKAPEGEEKDTELQKWQERDDVKKSVDETIALTYLTLRNSFGCSLDKHSPLRWSSLRPEDWLTKKFPIYAPGRIMDYVKDLIGWIVPR